MLELIWELDVFVGAKKVSIKYLKSKEAILLKLGRI